MALAFQREGESITAGMEAGGQSKKLIPTEKRRVDHELEMGSGCDLPKLTPVLHFL